MCFIPWHVGLGDLSVYFIYEKLLHYTVMTNSGEPSRPIFPSCLRTQYTKRIFFKMFSTYTHSFIHTHTHYSLIIWMPEGFSGIKKINVIAFGFGKNVVILCCCSTLWRAMLNCSVLKSGRGDHIASLRGGIMNLLHPTTPHPPTTGHSRRASAELSQEAAGHL